MSRPASDDLVFKALGDCTRREILDLLKASARTTGQLCDHFRELDRCTVMQHIGVLEKAGLLIAGREGRRRWNHLDVMPIKRIHDRWISPYATSAVALLARLKEDLEGPAPRVTPRAVAPLSGLAARRPPGRRARRRARATRGRG